MRPYLCNMKENNNKKSWYERIAEYVMSGQAGPGIRQQIEDDGVVYRGTISREDLDAYMEATYNSRQEEIDNYDKNLTDLYKGELVKRKMIQEGTFKDFMNGFNKHHPEWQNQKKN